MTIVISIINQKGGVGKTTTALNLSHYFAEQKLKTLAVDLDGQFNLSESFRTIESNNGTISEFLIDGKDVKVVEKSSYLHVIPSDLRLMTFDAQVASKVGRERILATALSPILKNYDICVLDCPPSLNTIVINGMAMSDYVLIPLTAGKYAFQGLDTMIEYLTTVKAQINPKLLILGIVLTKYAENRIASKQALDRLTTGEFGLALMETRIRLAEGIIRSEDAGLSILEYDSISPVAEDYRNLGKEIINKIKASNE